MEILSSELLIEAYKKARQYNLEEDFIQLILEELEKRGIEYEWLDIEKSS